jgi:hypothetical protein
MSQDEPSARLATADEADEMARLLHDFNTEFGSPSPGASVLADRLRGLLAGERTIAILAGTPPVGVGLITSRPNERHGFSPTEPGSTEPALYYSQELAG